MNFRQLEIMISIVRHGSFTGAASDLYLTQPTISAQVDSLEKELGVLLFDRQPRRTVLTEAGRLFYPYALDIIELRNRACERLKHYQETVEGTVRVAASSTPGNYLLPRLIGPFAQRFPAVSFQVATSSTAQVVEAIADYRAEVGLVGSVPAHEQFGCLTIGRDRMVAIAPPNPELADSGQVGLRQLTESPFIIRRPGSATRAVLEQALAGVGLSIGDLRVVLETDSLEAVKNSVRAGLGISVVPELSLRGNEGVRRLALADLEITREFYAVFHRRRVFSPAVNAFLKYLEQEVALR
ncbi:MAG: selenium metabolism-associated LysR family transcriptional regulator [Bacillota bacterium]